MNNKMEISIGRKLDLVRALQAKIKAIVASMLIRQARLKETLGRVEA